VAERRLRIMLSAGEASGDRLGAGLAKALLRRRPDLELFGMGGPQMSAAGVRLIQDASEVAVVGLFEVLTHLPTLLRAMKRLESGLTRDRPDLLVPIDFPDFNLRLAARANRARVPVVYYVSPQVWAWRKWRVRTIRERVRRMLVLFPFESSFYDEAHVPVDFVGYPVDQGEIPDHAALCGRIGLDPGRPVVALLPGSRQGEVGRQLPGMLAAARILSEGRPGLQFVVPRAAGLPDGWLEGQVTAGLPDARVWKGDYPAILRICRAGVVASGTATLDAALAGLPSVVVYRINAMSYAIAKRLVNLEHVALPNLIVGRKLFPELIQHDFTPAKVAAAIAPWLDDDTKWSRIREELREVRERMESSDAFDRAACAVLEEIVGATPE